MEDIITEPTIGAGDRTAAAPSWVLGGRYRVLDRLGSGGVADVFRAHDELLGRDVAVKVFRAVPEPSGQGVTPDPLASRGRENELRALARLNHPNLITLYDASMDEQPAFLVMELVDGPSLATRLVDGPLVEADVRAMGGQLADALAYVHSLGMVHRDVKPGNVLIGDLRHDWGRARLSDFGIARLIGSERLTSADVTLGTPSYLAPEQARGGDVGPAADVYSLGLVLIEALTGVRCFDGPPLEAMSARLFRDPEVPADLPTPWPALLRAMTARDPADRPPAVEVSRCLADTGALDALATAVVAPAAFAAAPLLADAQVSGVARPSDSQAVPAAGALGYPESAAADPPPRRVPTLAVVSFVLLALLASAGALAMVGRGGHHRTPPPAGITRTSAGAHATVHPSVSDAAVASVVSGGAPAQATTSAHRASRSASTSPTRSQTVPAAPAPSSVPSSLPSTTPGDTGSAQPTASSSTSSGGGTTGGATSTSPTGTSGAHNGTATSPATG